MISRKLQEAREFEENNIPLVAPELPRFHVTGGVGWINDPNGFAPYKDEYHLFFQYHPFDTKWGPMHWGHVKTKDFIHWDRLPVAMAPDTEYDKFGCFSGGAVEMPDGRHLLMYTGVRSETDANGNEVCFQTQCIAFGDGENYEKYEGNPVIRADQIPEEGSIYDFRDPHIWYEDGEYWCVLGNLTPDSSGAILLYKSKDAINWDYVSTLDSCKNEYGKMWECPDFFRLDGKSVLLISPTDTQPKGLEIHVGHANICIIGDYDEDTDKLLRNNVQAIDYGLDFYAPQTLETYDGRRVMIGWMQNWDSCNFHMPNQKFMGMMTIPRELSIRNGRLCQEPVREIEKYRVSKIAFENVPLGQCVDESGRCKLEGIRGRFIDLTVTARPENRSEIYNEFSINLACNDSFYTKVAFYPNRNIMKIDRTYSGLPFDIVNVREFPVSGNDGEVKIRIIMDRYSIELFVNDGMQAASTIIYTPLEADEIEFSCEGAVNLDIEKYDLMKNG